MSKVNRFSVDFTIIFKEEYLNFAKFTEKDLKWSSFSVTLWNSYETLQNLQESNCWTHVNNASLSRPVTALKRESSIGDYIKILHNFSKFLFYQTSTQSVVKEHLML